VSSCGDALQDFSRPLTPSCGQEAVSALCEAYGLSNPVFGVDLIDKYMARLANYLLAVHGISGSGSPRFAFLLDAIKTLDPNFVPNYENRDEALKVFNPRHEILMLAVKQWVAKKLVFYRKDDLYSDTALFDLASFSFTPKDGGFIDVSSTWVKNYIKHVTLRVSRGGKLVSIKRSLHKQVASFVYAALLEASILTCGDYSFDSVQTWVPRFIRPATGDSKQDLYHLSLHSFGLAFDVNPSRNKRGMAGDVATLTGPLNLIPGNIIESWGFGWGARWGSVGDPGRDPMHFQMYNPHHFLPVIV